MRLRLDAHRKPRRAPDDRRRRRRERATGVATITALAGTAIVAASSTGLANPKGGQVSAGMATIHNTSPTQLDIVQKTNRAVIDWQSFNIAVGERTNFQQPSAASMTLNRVHAPDPSTIAGQLNANGSLVLINPNGVVFSRGSQVNVHSLIATPTDISNANFMAGKMRFDRPSPNPNARVVNDGSITVAQKGLAALVAPGVANSGVIQANMGHVVLAGAETFTVDFYGDGLINFDIGSRVGVVPRDANGTPLTSLVSNTGTINAPGGTVLLTAEAAAGILANVIDASGQINAPTMAGARGVVTVDAGSGNAARLAGTVNVSASAATQTGGTAIVTGEAVTVASTARIDARAPAGGGTVKIGGGAHGADKSVRNARNTSVNAGAIIDASATDRGSGGTVAVWSDGNTVFNGTIYARGGPNGGNGGWVETSGHTLAIANSAVVDASPRTPGGTPGVWLLDPTDLTVASDVPDTNVTPPPVIAPVASPATVSNTTIQNALNLNNNVILDTIGSPDSGAETGAITVNAPVAWTTATTLTLNAAGNIQINSPITGSNSGSVFALNAAGTVSQSVEGTITVGTLTGISTGGTTLTAANSVDTLGSFINSGAGGFTFANNKSLTVTGPINGGTGISSGGAPITSVQIETTGPASTLTIAGLIEGSSSDGFGTPYAVRLHATGAITETSTGSISAGSLLARTQNDSGAPIILDNPANAIPGSVTLSTLNASGTARAPGAITFFDSTGFTINGVGDSGVGGLELGIATTGTATLQAAGTIDQNGEFGIINAQNLVARTLSDEGADILLGTANNVVPGNVTLTALNAAGTALAPGSIDFFNTPGFTIASLGGLQTGIATTADAIVISEGPISEAPGAVVVADFLSLESAGGATLTGANQVNNLELFDFEAGPLTFTNAGVLTVLEADSAGALTLTTTGGAGSTLTLDGDVTGTVVTLTSSGPINQTAGIITANTLMGSAGGAANFAQNNLIAFLDGFSTMTGGANGDFTLRNGQDLIVSNTVSTGSGTLTLDTGFSGLILNAPLLPSPGGVLLSSGTINLTADNMALDAQVGGSAPGVGSAALVNIFPFSANQPISLGTGAVTGLALDSSELNNIRAAEVNIGNSSAGALTFGAFIATGEFATTLLSLATGTTATFNGALSLNGGLLVSAPAGIDLNGVVVSTAGPQTYNDPVVLTRNTTLSSTEGGITFGDSVDGAFFLNVSAAGTTAFNGPVGATTPLTFLAIETGGTIDINAPVVNTIGGQTYGNPVILTEDTVLTSAAGGDIVFASTVNGSFALTVNTSGITVFEGAIGGTAALASLATDGLGSTDLNGGGVNTIGPQSYKDPVFLTADAVLSSTGSGSITFAQTVDSATGGPFALTVNTGGTTAFDGAVGGTAALASVTTDAPGATDLNGSAVLTTGVQTYNDPVVLTSNMLLTSTGAGPAGNITFGSTVNGPFDLIVTTAGTTAFNGTVGGTAPPVSLAATGAAIAVNAPITTSGPLTLNSTVSGLSLAQDLTADTVTLLAAGPINQTAGGITAFALTGSSVDGAILTGTNQLGTVATFTNTASGPLTVANDRDLTTNGLLSSPGDVTLTTRAGALTIASDIAATSGDVNSAALAGPLSLTGPIGVSAGRDISITAAGAIDILGPTSGSSLLLSAGRDILLTSGFGPGNFGGVTLSGTITMKAGDPNIVIAADGPFRQSGTLNVLSADYVIIDTTGTTAQQRLTDLMQAIDAAGVQTNPDPVVITDPAFNPNATSANAIEFAGTLTAEDSVLLLIANQGPITGGSSDNPAIFVEGLGISGRGSQAQLFGTVAGNAAETAATSARINPLTDPAYLFNNCVIGSTACAVPPEPPEPPEPPPSPDVVIDPQLTTEAAILVSLPSDTAEALLRPQPASEVDILVARPAEDDPDTPLVNIFDEERLCEVLLRTNPELAREVCR